MHSDFFLVYLFFYFLTYKNLWKMLLTDLNHSKQSQFLRYSFKRTIYLRVLQKYWVGLLSTMSEAFLQN